MDAEIWLGLTCLLLLGVWVFVEIAHRFGPGDQDEWDEVADRKRRTERRAKLQSGEFR